jgi:hypothetical protein
MLRNITRGLGLATLWNGIKNGKWISKLELELAVRFVLLVVAYTRLKNIFRKFLSFGCYSLIRIWIKIYCTVFVTSKKSDR